MGDDLFRDTGHRLNLRVCVCSCYFSRMRNIIMAGPSTRSLTVCTSKIKTTFLYTHRVITPAQYGFVRQRSTADQLVVLTSTIAASLDKGDHYESLFLDFAKAFDSVPHQVLLSILSTLCRPSSLAWFSNYLSNRQLTVRVGSSLSTPPPIPSNQVCPKDYIWARFYSFCILTLCPMPSSCHILRYCLPMTL